VQYIDEETARLMRDSGCRGVFLGVESANDVVLKNMNKRATRADFLRGMDLLQKYNIMSVATFIIGFPGESEQSIKDNIDFIENTSVRFYTLKEFYYIENTPIYHDREKYGLTGMGPKWKHDTMDSATAHKIKMNMFQTIKNAIFIDPDTSLWYLVYLYDQGFTMDEIALIQDEINKVMLDQVNGKIDDNHPGFENVRKILSRIPDRKRLLVRV
jgi:p-methyltransferase